MKKNILALSLFLLVSSSGLLHAEYLYYLPVLKTGQPSWNGLGLANLSSSASSKVSINIFDDTGKTRSAETKEIAADGQSAFLVGSDFNFYGWMKVSSESPLAILNIHGENIPAGVLTTIPYSESLATNWVIPYASRSAEWSTAVYLTNPNDSQVITTLTYSGTDGSKPFSPYTVTIPAVGSTHIKIDQIVGENIIQDGRINVSATGKIVTFSTYTNFNHSNTSVMPILARALDDPAVASAFGSTSVDCGDEDGMPASISGAKNIIFMVADGMGLADVTASRIFKNGQNGNGLVFESLPSVGYQRTNSNSSVITDSAAAASAWATGEKFDNDEISCHSSGGVCTDSPGTILEYAKSKGKATGLVTTANVSHGTPAAFGAHVHNRNCQTEIARQFIEEAGVEVILGGGIPKNSSDPVLQCSQYVGQDRQKVLAVASSSGYELVTTKTDLFAAAARDSKVLGLFTPAGKTPENFQIDPQLSYDQEEPTLAEMASAALDILDKDTDGFFILIEGGQIDWANHDNRFSIDYDAPEKATQLGEILAFDNAVQTVMDWVNETKNRQENTLVIVTADHETGGFTVTGPKNSTAGQGEQVDVKWINSKHSGVDTMVWSQGPGSTCLGKALDNTDLFKIMKGTM